MWKKCDVVNFWEIEKDELRQSAIFSQSAQGETHALCGQAIMAEATWRKRSVNVFVVQNEFAGLKYKEVSFWPGSVA